MEKIHKTMITCIIITLNKHQGIWLARLIGELMNEDMISMKLMVDNKSANSRPKIHVFHNSSKHIKKRLHMVVEYTPSHIKGKSKLTNLKMNSPIEGYKGK